MRPALPPSAPAPASLLPVCMRCVSMRSVAKPSSIVRLFLVPVLCAILLFPFALSARAVDWSNHRVAPVKGAPGDGASDDREGGETYADAIAIAAVPYEDQGATCDNENDITPSCGYSIAPDVVYSFTPSLDGAFDIDLCDSGYDTILEVRDDTLSPIACNDDACGLQSTLVVELSRGRTYYIIVDGYGDACGSYRLRFSLLLGPCGEYCDPIEGEPACHDEYVDEYNGGCNSEPPAFQPMWGDGQGMAAMCGESGTYLFDGLSYRDTDWFQVVGTGTTARASLHGEFDYQLLIIYDTNCENLGYISATGSCWETIALEQPLQDGAIAWIWVGPSRFNGVSCGSDYLLEVTGISAAPTSAEGTAWGGVKRLFR